jgi:transcriptional regulator with XRE-family HTH domain
VSGLAVTADVPEDEQKTTDRPRPAVAEPDAARTAPAGTAAAEAADAGTAEARAQDINPLQRLIRQRMQEQGWSYGEVGRRGGLPRSTVYTLATTRNLARPPRPATLNGLAWGLDVPVAVVRSAAAESTGLHYYDDELGGPEASGDPERDLLIASIDELTAEDRQHVAALVESLRRKTAGQPDHEPPEPPH